MKKQYQYLLISIAVIIAGAGAWYYLFYRKKRKALEDLDGSSGAMQTAAGKPAVKKSIIRDVGESHMVKKEFPLKKGSRGELVRKAQIYMNEQGIQPPLKTDGIFGPKTEAAALKVFKNKFIGEKVWQDKMSTPPVDITQQISWRAKNINLAKNIWNDDEEAVYTALEGLNKQQKEALETYFKERYQVNMWAFIGAFLNTQELNEAKRIYAAT